MKVPFNSLVFVATQIGQRQFLLDEVYRVAAHLPLVTQWVGTWDGDARRLTWTREANRTGDLHVLTIKAAMNHVSNFALVASRIFDSILSRVLTSSFSTVIPQVLSILRTPIFRSGMFFIH